jgi:hypothetical protein
MLFIDQRSADPAAVICCFGLRVSSNLNILNTDAVPETETERGKQIKVLSCILENLPSGYCILTTGLG